METENLFNRFYSLAIRLIPKNGFGDRLFSLIEFYRGNGRLPRTDMLFNDYLYRLKNSDEAMNPLRAYVSDKEFLKNYVTAKIGPEYNVPTLKVLHSMDEARNYDFPKRCCIKPTHLSGVVILREDGEEIDFEEIQNWLGRNYYYSGREKNYRYLKPKIIVEPLIFDSTDNEDIKFFCYKGVAKFLQIDFARATDHRRLYFDRDWVKQSFSRQVPMSDQGYERPANLDALLTVADMLSDPFEFIRVDLYTDGEKIHVGELTSYPGNGKIPFIPESAEIQASDLLFS